MANTPIPSRAIEYSSTGAGGLREYTLTPEQLEEVRQKYPATKADRSFKKPVAHNPRADLTSEEQRRRANMRYQNQEEGKNVAKFKMTAEEYFAQRQAGKTQEKIAEDQGVTTQAIDYHLKKWAEEGKQVEPDKTQLLREKEVVSASSQSAEVDLLVAAKKEIVEVRAKLQMVKDDFLTVVDERDQLRTELAEVKEMFDKAYQRNVNGNAKIGEHLQAIKELKAELEEVTKSRDIIRSGVTAMHEEREELRDELNRMITERDELVADRDELHREKTGWIENERMLNHLVEQLRSDLQKRQAEPQLADKPSEVQLLDRSIADLTRARWILNRLTASGE